MRRDEKIRAMDGPALCKIAFSLGLAPEGTDLWDDMPDGMLYDFAQREPWEPHVNLAQANAALRQLRVKGWAIDIAGTYDRGGCCATKRPGKPIVCWWGGNYADTEPLALLRCACLAIASTQEDA